MIYQKKILNSETEKSRKGEVNYKKKEKERERLRKKEGERKNTKLISEIFTVIKDSHNLPLNEIR